MYIPTEIWNHIFSYLPLKYGRLINTKICDSFHHQFVGCMHKITEQHIIDYYYEADQMCFFNKTSLKMVHYGNKHVSKNDYNKSINYITYDMDLMSIYNILKCRDIYKLNYAKNYILTILSFKKLILYAKGNLLHIDIYEWLKYNMMTMGIIIKHNQTATDMYNILENHIKKYL